MGTVTVETEQTEPVWREMGGRVAVYLRACRINDPVLRHRLVERVLGAARHAQQSQPERAPVELVAEEIQRLVDEWTIRFIQPAAAETAVQRFAHARSAAVLADLAHRWPGGFLSPEAAPEKFGREFRDTYLEAGPELDFSPMTPRPIDFGPVSSLAGETWKTFDKWPILRGAVVWGLFTGLLLLALYAMHY